MEPLEKIQKIFEKYTTAYHFYLKDLRTGQEYELGTKQRYPICSCFKLAVLMAYFDSIHDEKELFEEVTIPPEKFSPGGGMINYFTTPVKFTYYQLAQMMMAFSDGTATDILIEKVGLEEVQKTLKKHTGESAIVSNLTRMVSNFLKDFSISELKNGGAQKSIPTFEDFTNAKDLALLSMAANFYENSPNLLKHYLSCLHSKRQLPRTAMFFNDNVRLIGKGGSLGYVYFGNDSGNIYQDKNLIGSLGITAAGFRHDKDVVEILFGMIGLNILTLLKLPAVPNIRYTQATGALFE